MTDIGVATRVHGREESFLIFYRLYRNLWRCQQRSLDPRADKLLILAIAWRSRWSALREIIDAEERRAVAQHMKQSINGCVTCNRPWTAHTPAERGAAA